ncbi:MAG: hypothetical protein PUQ00_20580 [Nostoc sp. S13]|nr:hypothetical protein [Nostoc sp. S13]
MDARYSLTDACGGLRQRQNRCSTPEDSDARRQECTGWTFRWVGLRLRN